VAGIITISKGHDASYPWKQIGTEPDSGQSKQPKRYGVGYYLSPAERGGEPPGIWTGKDVAELGLEPGGIVDRKVFEPLYGRHLDPRDPAGQARLGRAPGSYKPADIIYQTLLALEPHATAERRDQLMIEAKAQVRTPDLYRDATFSVSKSISLFHASALANAAAATASGDRQGAAAWEEVADRIWAAIMEGNAAALDYLQREAGQTRAGYHPGGRWEDARQWMIASFRQHTSRDGDPQLHVHNLILHKVRRESDGQWRALDSMSWSEPFGVPRRYLANHASLGYATTVHASLGRTTDTTHTLVDGLADRQSLYVAMSRGRNANYAYCVTRSPRLADIAAGTSRAPELDRATRLAFERAGLPPPAPAPDPGKTDDTPVLDPVTVLAAIMARDGSELSATETLERELANADHLGVLGGIWDDVTRSLQAAKYTNALRAALPADQAEQVVNDPASTWLWRTLREAETTGLDASSVLREAVQSRSMAGARDIARVLDARIRRTIKGRQPHPPGRWADRVPAGGPAELTRYLRELAELMDDRARRLGEHTAQTQPAWARHALGPLPRDPAAALDWEHRASIIAAYRERYGYDHPADPIGPEPATMTPEARAAWHAALAAAGQIDGIDLRHCTDGELWLRRGTYERQTAWAPLAVLVHRDTTAAVLDTQSMLRWTDRFAQWLAETDLRGWDDQLGWLQAMAHGADVIGELGQPLSRRRSRGVPRDLAQPGPQLGDPR
jgi:hypothetical protein